VVYVGFACSPLAKTGPKAVLPEMQMPCQQKTLKEENVLKAVILRRLGSREQTGVPIICPQARIADSSSRKAVSFSFACTTKRFPSPRCASTIQIVHPLELMAETHTKNGVSFAKLFSAGRTQSSLFARDPAENLRSLNRESSPSRARRFSTLTTLPRINQTGAPTFKATLHGRFIR